MIEIHNSQALRFKWKSKRTVILTKNTVKQSVIGSCTRPSIHFLRREKGGKPKQNTIRKTEKFTKKVIIFEFRARKQLTKPTSTMKISSFAVLFLSSVALGDDKNLRKRTTLERPEANPGVGDNIASALEGAAKAARYEASVLQAVADMDALEGKTKARIQEIAASAHYEATILEDAAGMGEASANHRILKDKKLPNGSMCNYCPDDDDDDFVWPPTTFWSPNWRKLEVEDVDAKRLLKDKKLPNGSMCNYCPDDDDDDFVWPPTTFWSPNWRKLKGQESGKEVEEEMKPLNES